MKKDMAKYKNSVFCMLFDNQDKLRSLYNVLTGSSYGKDTPVHINTLNDPYGLQNDISFTIGGKKVVLVEHQSSINPNMPVRFLLYMTSIYEMMISRKTLYGERKITLPHPEFYLLYNGLDPFPDKMLIKLSESFEDLPETTNPCLELVVKAFNINVGYNEQLLKKNRDIGDYARFVAIVRKKQVGRKNKKELQEAVMLAIQECIDNNILREFLKLYREEVMSSILFISQRELNQIRREEEREKKEEAKKKLEEERKKLEEVKKSLEEAKKKLEEEQKKQKEAKKSLEEEKKKLEEEPSLGMIPMY